MLKTLSLWTPEGSELCLISITVDQYHTSTYRHQRSRKVFTYIHKSLKCILGLETYYQWRKLQNWNLGIPETHPWVGILPVQRESKWVFPCSTHFQLHRCESAVFSPKSHAFFRGKTGAPFWSFGPMSQQCVPFVSFRWPQLLLPQDEDQKDSPFGLCPLPFLFQGRTTELKEGAEPVFFPWDYAHAPVYVRVLRPHKNPLSGLSWGTSPAQTPGSEGAGPLTCSHVCLPLPGKVSLQLCFSGWDRKGRRGRRLSWAGLC